MIWNYLCITKIHFNKLYIRLLVWFFFQYLFIMEPFEVNRQRGLYTIKFASPMWQTALFTAETFH